MGLKFKVFIFVLFIILILSSQLRVALSNEVSSVITAQTQIQQHMEMVILVVDKSALKAELMLWPGSIKDSKVIASFKIAIGKEFGDKQTAGDNKTPEGIYFTQRILEKKDLLPKYGPNAIILNYPNPMDRYVGKTGSGIWLHGVIDDQRIEEANVTEGCVAFYNSDIVKLIQWLRPYQGVVVIGATKDDINNFEVLLIVKKLTNAWIKAWASRDIDKYISFYSKDFRFETKNREQYYKYKKRVFKSYKKMVVNMSNLRVLAHKKYAVSIMNQDFFGDNRFTSLGRKILYWINENGEWRILREIFENRRFELINYDEAKLFSLTNKASVSSL